MAIQLTDLAQAQADKVLQNPIIVLEIDGYDFVFSTDSLKRLEYESDVGTPVDGDWATGNLIAKTNVYPYISMEGTSSTISQQLLQDKGGSSSVGSIQISLLDKDELITRLISPSVELTDILGRKAIVYLGYKNTAFPRDYIVLFNGIIDDVTSGSQIVLNISHPEQLKRQEIFQKIESELDGAINNSVTALTLSTTTNMLLPASPYFLTYVRIDDEIIQYTGISGSQITGCTRGALSTTAVSHDDEASVTTFYRLSDQAIDLALKIMSSGGDEYWIENIPVENFRRTAPSTNTTNTLFFEHIDLKAKHGVTIGDFITTTGATNAGNNFSLRTVTDIETNDDGTIVTVSGAALTVEVGSSAVAKFKSKYNVLTDGLGLTNDQIDVYEFERISDLFSATIPDLDFYLKDTMKAKDFIDKEIFFPSNLYSLPRQGRVSLGIVSPPLSVSALPALNADNVLDPSKIQIRRSIGKYFYNTIVYKFEEDTLEDKKLAGYIRIDTDSQAQIPVGTKQMLIDSKGLRSNNPTTVILDITSVRMLERYKFAAEMITCSARYSKTFNVDIGDLVIFGDTTGLPLPDSSRGARGFTPRVCEIVDKKLNIKTGKVDLVLVDTAYLTSGRYGVFSPSTIIGVGSTSSSIVITDSYGTTAPKIEKQKWREFIGQKIAVRSLDWSVYEETYLSGFDPADNYKMLVSPALSFTPSADQIIEIAAYGSGDAEENATYKAQFCYFDPQLTVVSGASSTIFTVSSGDAAKLFVGCTIVIHSQDWAAFSVELKVESITGTTITTNKSIGFTPSAGQKIDLVGFASDYAPAYRFL